MIKGFNDASVAGLGEAGCAGFFIGVMFSDPEPRILTPDN